MAGPMAVHRMDAVVVEPGRNRRPFFILFFFWFNGNIPDPFGSVCSLLRLVE